MACGRIVHFWPPGTTRRKLPQKFNFSKLRVSPTHEAKEYGFWGRTVTRDMPSRLTGCLASALYLLVIATETGCGTASSPPNGAAGDVLNWKGRTWNVTTGGMAGVAKGDPANVFVDQNGYLHLRIINRGGTYTASELFSTDKIGFGTYQWQVEGHADNMDKSTVLKFSPMVRKRGLEWTPKTRLISSFRNGTTRVTGATRISLSIRLLEISAWVPRRTTSLLA